MANKLAKKDYDKDGEIEAPDQEYKGVRSKAIKKAKGKKTSKSKEMSDTKKPITESKNISNFITAISTKNYAQANKYLKDVIEAKLQARISASLNEPLF